jgi:hypothetical protein
MEEEMNLKIFWFFDFKFIKRPGVNSSGRFFMDGDRMKNEE